MPSLTIWTRLEPRCRTADMTAGLEARTHDPFWMLARQWQFGEFTGDDAGSPIVAAVSSLDAPLDRYAGPDGVAQSIPPSVPIEAWIEREGVRPGGTVLDYRQVAESGLQFLRMLRAAKMDAHVPAYVTQFALAPPAAADLARMDSASAQMIAVLARRVPDGVRLAAALRAAMPNLAASSHIAATDVAIVLQVAKDFLAWYDSLFDEPPAIAAAAPAPSSAWVDGRMEYSFTLDASTSEPGGAFTASRYTGEPLSWTSFDRTTAPLGPPAAAAGQPTTRTLIPTPVGFKGMPARRFWEMEDAQVDVGAIEAGPGDLGRLMLREFALIYGNDWFIVPIPVLVGSISRITSLIVTDTFGVAQQIPHYSQTADGARWHMFAVSGDVAPHGLLMPPGLARHNDSDALEQVLLVRDEAANMAWAVERIVQAPSGAALDRSSLPAVGAPSPSAPPSIPRFELGTPIPDGYVPFIPTAIGSAQRRMRRGALMRADGVPEEVAPRTRMLATEVPMFEEEFQREGIELELCYRLARWTDGSTHLWLARRKQVGATARSSGLRFDVVVEPGT
jgi:hypothetical protein